MEERYDLRELLREIEEDEGEKSGPSALSQEMIQQIFLMQRKERSARDDTQS